MYPAHPGGDAEKGDRVATDGQMAGEGTGPRWLGSDPVEEQGPPLTRRRVVEAALRLVDEHGLHALTFRKLASELGTSPMAPYSYVRNKEELLDLMLDLVLGEIDLSAPRGSDWAGRLRAMFRSYHLVLAAHPGIAGVYRERVKIGPNGLRAIDHALSVLREAGFTRAGTVNAFFALFNYTIGFEQIGEVDPADHGLGRDDGQGGDVHEIVRAFFSALPPGEIPNIVALAPYLTGAKSGRRFEYGLDLILAGLQAKHAARAKRRAGGSR